MPRKISVNYKMDGVLVFVQEFLKHPLQIGSIIPSSRYLERRIVAASGIASANIVVELGAGTGGVTRAILRAMPQQAKLLSMEINPHFHTLLKNIEDDRLIAHLGSADDLKEVVSLYDLDAPNVVISGIPFSTMSRSAGSQILEAVSSLLVPDGRFVAYQVSNRVAALCQPFLGSGKTTTEFLNIPPMRIFQWDKGA
ncbi:methyltransferase type 12 [Halomonas urmiana]|uniref:Methyltransferase type 12 n=1 Tax=Halomonas urmiana TaxID=490901 RepID=A0A5R8M965_9GAMM|nr:methyltransferase type 12 [Halomonas urmiana]TLF46057.1 methyltransferase type 12 [Halomonas urmiana]